MPRSAIVVGAMTTHQDAGETIVCDRLHLHSYMRVGKVCRFR
jgi:hypothetical protein